MEQARILHCEDSEQWQEVIAAMLSTSGLHRVVASAQTLGESLRQVEAIKAKELDANVILLDGNLEGGQGLNHPRYVINKMRELGLSVPVLGLSLDGLVLKGMEVGVDIRADLLKEEVAADPDLLAEALDELPEPRKSF